jgi:uncharacterized protein
MKRFSMFHFPSSIGIRSLLKCGAWCFSGAWSFVLGILGVGIITVIRLYQVLLSPVLTFIFGPTAGCRYTPTCSCYAREAVQTHGAIRGSWLAAKRVCRCHPWGGHGEDPVPQHFTISNFKSPAA